MVKTMMSSLEKESLSTKSRRTICLSKELEVGIRDIQSNMLDSGKKANFSLVVSVLIKEALKERTNGDNGYVWF